ncbi:hypothetical protein [Actinophytocola glycyrrhizae]|uniref:DUF3137 domain-containing protein n=1 Tax=Actinophytocola glycyrrhizae TaxID=2044873 RepID=A0ABV9SER4_9PSEU
MNTTLLVIVVVVVVAAVMFFQYQAHKKKVEAFTALAGERGWRYTERDRGLARRFTGTPFGEGHGRDARHVLTGTHRGRPVLAFEYSYKETRGSGDDRRTRTYHYTIVSTGLPAPKPTLQLNREGLGRKLLGFVGVRDLQLESDEFNRTFHIRTENDRFAYDVLHPRMMEWMLADERALTTPFRFEQADLLTWQEGKIDVSDVDALLNYLCDVLDHVPTFVWKP